MNELVLWYAIRDTMAVFLISAPLIVVAWGMWECLVESMEEPDDRPRDRQ